MLILAFGANRAEAQTFGAYSDLHDFGGTVMTSFGFLGYDGHNPYAGVTIDSAGNAYGTSLNGGPYSGGNVWKITPAGVYVDLHDFGFTIRYGNGNLGPDGNLPRATVTLDDAGNMFGTCSKGGQNGNGVVWEITSAGVYKDLHDFGGPIVNNSGSSGMDGKVPYGGVTFDSVGNMYGTTANGGGNTNYGMVWEITSLGKYIDLHDFGGLTTTTGGFGLDGQFPYAGVTFDSSGNMFGTTDAGGLNNYGLVWEIDSTGTYQDLHDFGGYITTSNGGYGPDGQYPRSSVTLDSAGNLYGTTYSGGSRSAYGMIWEFTKSGRYVDLHDFGGFITNSNGSVGYDGYAPQGGVKFDANGNMFGCTVYGGLGATYGMVWGISNLGNYFDVHDFAGTVTSTGGVAGVDGQFPYGDIGIDLSGNLYGTTNSGGPTGGNAGIVWKLQSIAFTNFTVTPNSVVGGTTVTASITLSGPAGASGATVNLSSDTASISVPSSIIVAPGATTAGFTINTPKLLAGVNAKISATLGATTIVAPLDVNPSMSGFTVNPTTVVGGTTATGTVSLNGTAAPAGVVVSISSNSASATVPATFTIPGGASSGSFTINTNVVNATTTAIFAVTDFVTTHNSLTITPGGLTNLTLSPSTVYGGSNSVGTITLSAPAPSGGTVVNLSSNDVSAVVPTTVVVSAGATTATFTITTLGVDATTTPTITATLGSTNKTASITVKQAVMSGFSVSPSTVVGGSSATGNIILHGQAGPSGIAATVSSNIAAATVPASVVIPYGSASGTFTINTNVVNSTVNAVFTVTCGVTSHNSLQITPGGLKSLSLSVTTVYGGSSSTGTVTLSAPAPVGGTSISLASDNAGASVPPTVTVPSGATSATFSVDTTGVDTTLVDTISATLGATTRTAGLTINAAVLSGFSVAPSSVIGGDIATGTISLHGQAGPSGVVAAVTSDNTAAIVPATVTIPFGATTGTFTINTTVVGSTKFANFAVTYGVTTHNSLTITAGGLSSFTLSQSTVYGGSSSTGMVTLSAPAPAGGTVINLSSDDPSATLPTTVTVAAGSNSASFTINTVGVDADVTAHLAASLGANSITDGLTVKAAVLQSFVISPNSVVGGSSVTGSLTLRGLAGPSGAVVTVSSNIPSATAPSTVTIPSGASSGSFTINTSVVGSTTTAIFTVTLGVTTHNSLTITPGGLMSFRWSPSAGCAPPSLTLNQPDLLSCLFGTQMSGPWPQFKTVTMI